MFYKNTEIILIIYNAHRYCLYNGPYRTMKELLHIMPDALFFCCSIWATISIYPYIFFNNENIKLLIICTINWESRLSRKRFYILYLQFVQILLNSSCYLICYQHIWGGANYICMIEKNNPLPNINVIWVWGDASSKTELYCQSIHIG